MFERVLVANRGEIACRIQRTLRRMQVSSVAVYTDADEGSLHVAGADDAVRIGEGPVSTSYLDGGAVIDAAVRSGAAAIHPGYGFLSENADFAEACVSAGLTWIGPDPDHLRRFGEKHEARALAVELDVPLLPGSGVLTSLDEARLAAARIGFPVMLKATAGGGGIGMQRCDDVEAVDRAYEVVARLARDHFGSGAVFVERFVRRARHVEVQVFGTRGRVVVLGDRDCSAQRRHQKVIEEAPAPSLEPALRDALWSAAARLVSAVGYRSAGTVEFLVDADRAEAAFLEVNTRLQVEHGVTERVTGIDLVEWMVREAAGELDVDVDRVPVTGAAIEARVYAEDAAHGFRPGTGVLSAVVFPPDVRVDTWIESGTEIGPFYDPLLAKVIVAAPDRDAAVAAMSSALDRVRIDGVETNVAFVADAVSDDRFVAGNYTTALLDSIAHRPATVEVLQPGMQTTVQDHPGRLGFWAVGVPPSGPMDDLSFRLGNRLVGNDRGAAGLEMTFTGATLRFDVPATIALCGAEMEATLDGTPLRWWAPVPVPAGGVVRVGRLTGAGSRAYLLVAGGFDVPAYLGSRSTFLLGRFGGHCGRALATGDVLHIGAATGDAAGAPLPPPLIPEIAPDWEIGIIDGPHGAPDFITPEGIDSLHDAWWEVHHHSDRTGVRLLGPAPEWARADGGEAGLHPSNIHDTTYTVGAVDFTGDMPVILGPDGPSLGGFVCPFTVVAGERWKLGQLRAGDRVRFRRMGQDDAVRLAGGQEREIAALAPDERTPVRDVAPAPVGAVVPLRAPAPVRDMGPADPVALTADGVTFRRCGDRHLLVEFGENVLDLALRFRAHALMEALAAAAIPGVEELAPGIRSLQVRYDPSILGLDELVDAVSSVETALPPSHDLVVPSRVVHLPLSWDDPATRLAIERYMQVVRDDAPWCPWNIEFIRRINGLDSVDDVRRVVFDAAYLVLGLGDVYLGAPVATPLDPRHRLVTTKYNPARTWTPENAVGIGGAYLCVYGMEGPGGYQFVGRTVQVWSSYRREPQWLLRFFDQLRFHPVSADELLLLRRDMALGRHSLDIDECELRLADHERFLAAHAASIDAFRQRQQGAFADERARWEASGEMGRAAAPGFGAVDALDELPLPEGCVPVSTPVGGVVARTASRGARVVEGEAVVVVEAMKMETSVAAPHDGTVVELRCRPGQTIVGGATVAVLRPC